MELILNNMAVILTCIGAAAFFVSVVTQLTKEIGVLNRIPTAVQVIVLSLVVCVVGIFIYVDLNKAQMVWYYLVGAVILSFFVSFVTMYGWEKLSELWARFKK